MHGRAGGRESDQGGWAEGLVNVHGREVELGRRDDGGGSHVQRNYLLDHLAKMTHFFPPELLSYECDHGGVLAGGEEHLLEVCEHLRHEGQVNLAVSRSVSLMVGEFTRGFEKSLFIMVSVMTE